MAEKHTKMDHVYSYFKEKIEDLYRAPIQAFKMGKLRSAPVVVKCYEDQLVIAESSCKQCRWHTVNRGRAYCAWTGISASAASEMTATIWAAFCTAQTKNPSADVMTDVVNYIQLVTTQVQQQRSNRT